MISKPMRSKQFEVPQTFTQNQDIIFASSVPILIRFDPNLKGSLKVEAGKGSAFKSILLLLTVDDPQPCNRGLAKSSATDLES